MKQWKKVMACMTAAALAAGLPGFVGTGTEVVHAAGLEESLLLDFDFENLTAGDEINGGNAKAVGNYALAESYEGAGMALHLDGSAGNFLTVTDQEGKSLLNGVEEMTISYEAKQDRTATNWLFYAAPNQDKQEYKKEHYIGLMQNGGKLTAERYLNTTGRPASAQAAPGNDWTHVDVVLTKTDTTIYVNGTESSRVESSYGIKDILGENSILQIGKANWGNGEYCKGWIDNLKIYSRALTEEEIQQVPPQAFADVVIPQIAASIQDVTIEDAEVLLPNYSNTVTWKSQLPEIVIAENGLNAAVTQPATGEEAMTGTLTAVITKYGKSAEKEVAVTIRPVIGAEEAYGYMMVHFIEDSAGYAEKIYLDISRGDNPEQWDPLNGGEPILTSNLGTTGVRDPFLTYNPETETYYIIATDLRVFGGDNAGWGTWQKNYSTKMNVWESKDLIKWSDVRQFDVALDMAGNKQAQMGMMWAPEATWVPDYYGDGKGAFVVYWSSKLYSDDDVNQTSSTAYSKIMWGATTDFTQETYEFGGVFIDPGHTVIDTTIIQNGDKTYHITKDNGTNAGIYMEVTTAKEWWKPEAEWTFVQNQIGMSRFGAVEGPAVFKNHSEENSWYLFVDDLPTPGYQPMATNNLDAGWEYLDSSDYYLRTHTKHGGVISLTKGQYDAVRNADAVSAVSENLGKVQITKGETAEALEKALPKNAQVNLAYEKGTSELPVVWDLSAVDRNQEGTYEVTGVVQSIGSNKNQWAGKDNSTSYLAEDKQLYSSKEIQVTAEVEVLEAAVTLPYVDVDAEDGYYDAVAYNYFKKLMTGLDETHFGPNKNLSREQFAVILHRMSGTPDMEYKDIFSDVAADTWYTDAVLWANEAGVVTGYADTDLFGTGDSITREQMAVMMYRYANYRNCDTEKKADFSGFSNAEKVSAFAVEAMQWAVGNEIILGKNEGTVLDPQGKATRSECAVMIQRFMEHVLA